MPTLSFTTRSILLLTARYDHAKFLEMSADEKGVTGKKKTYAPIPGKTVDSYTGCLGQAMRKTGRKEVNRMLVGRLCGKSAACV